MNWQSLYCRGYAKEFGRQQCQHLILDPRGTCALLRNNTVANLEKSARACLLGVVCRIMREVEEMKGDIFSQGLNMDSVLKSIHSYKLKEATLNSVAHNVEKMFKRQSVGSESRKVCRNCKNYLSVAKACSLTGKKSSNVCKDFSYPERVCKRQKVLSTCGLDEEKMLDEKILVQQIRKFLVSRIQVVPRGSAERESRRRQYGLFEELLQSEGDIKEAITSFAKKHNVSRKMCREDYKELITVLQDHAFELP